MKLLAVGGFAAVGAVLLYMFVEQKPADVYDMPVNQAYGLLADVKYEPLSEGAIAAEIERTTVGNGSDKVTWATRGSHVGRSCDLLLAPFEGDANRTHVTVKCAGGGAGEGAAAGIAHNMHRNRVIERVDATLTGRPFDGNRVGATSSRWPDDGVDGSLGKAMGDALEMERDMHQLQQEMEQQAAQAEFYSDAGSGDFAADTPR
jgi:hypothetical protein